MIEADCCLLYACSGNPFKKCKHCRAVLDGTRNTVRLLTDGEWYPLPDGFGEQLFQRLSSEYRKDEP